MALDEWALQSVKLIGFVLFAVGVGMFFWSGFSFDIAQLVLVILGLLFSAGGFFLETMESPSDEELMRMHQKELEDLYKPEIYAEYDKRKMKYQALHRLRERNEAVGDFSGLKGH